MRVISFWPRHLSCERGAVAIHVAIAMTVVIGMVALGSEISYVLYKQRQMQAVTDTAALGGATALSAGYPGDFRTEARALTAAQGFVNGANGVTVTINNPPATGAHAGDGTAVEVIMTQPQTLNLVGLFTTSVVTVRARSVAIEGSGGGCVLALAPTGTGVSLTGSGSVNMIGCGLYVNSNNAQALRGTGSGAIHASTISIVGSSPGYQWTGSGGVTADDGAPHTGQSPAADPYADRVTPTPGACTQINYSKTGSSPATISPGTYCGGIRVVGSGSLTLNPGVYILKNGNFSVTGSAQITGNGVTIVLTGDTASQVGRVSFTGSTHINISAPTSGPTAGFAFFQDRLATAGNSNSLVGSSNQIINGAIYFPKGAVSYTGSGGTSATCVEMIAYTLSLTGSGQFQLNCGSIPVKAIGVSPSQLVE